MKKLIGSLGALAAVGLLSYPGLGYLVEKGLQHQMNAMPKQYGMTLELKDFQRHWFTSEAKLLWKWDIPAHLKQNDQGQTITISPQHYEKEVQLHIFHGPVVLRNFKPFLGVGYASTVFYWPFTAANEPAPTQFSKESIFPEIHVSMSLDFFMHTHWKTEVPPFKLLAQDKKAEIDWGGFVLKNTISTNLNRIKGQLNLKDLTIKKTDGVTEINTLDTAYDFKMDPVGLYIGDADFSLNHAQMAKDVFIDQVKIKNIAEVQNNLFSTRFDASLKSASLNGFQLGPFNAEFKLSQINAPALVKAQQNLQQQQNASPSFRSKGFLSLAAAIPELLKYGVKMDLSQFHLVLPDGSIDSHLSLILPADEASSSMMNLQRMQALKGDAEIKLSKTLLKNALVDIVEKQMKSQQQLALDPAANPASDQEIEKVATTRTTEKIEALVKAGVLREQNDTYVLNFKLQTSQVTVNDLPFDPAWLYF
jgi:uncharacterized protein YdgA (DUF945 family)